MSTRSFPSALPSVANTGSPRGRPLCFSRSTVLTGSSFSALSWPVEGGGSERPSPPLPLPLVCVFIGVCALSVHRFFFLLAKGGFSRPPPPNPQPVLLQDEVIIATMTAAFVTLATNDAYSVGALVLAQ